ncbi:MAG: AraC family transcriptional regulator [Candidatus Pacearchaeota archaeon]
MLIISIFFSIGIYLISKNIVTDYIIKNQIEIINNIKIIIDKEIETVSRIGLKFAFDSNLSQWISNIEKGEKVFDSIISIQKMLLNYLLTDSIIDEIYLYIYKPDIVFTHNIKYTFKEFKYAIQNNIRVDENELLRILKKIRNWRNVYLFKDVKENPVIFLIQSIPDSSYREFRGTLIVKLNSSKINNIITNFIDLQKYVIGIIDKNSNYYISGNSNLIKDINLKYEFLNQQRDYFNILNKKFENLCIICFKSNNEQLIYFSIFSLSLILEEIKHIKTTSLFYLSLYILFGIITAYILAERNYHPIKKLIDKISQNVKVNENLTKNEIKFLDMIFENIIEQNTKLESEIQEKTTKLVENLLIRLLKEHKGSCKQYQEINNLNLSSKILLIGVLINKIEDRIFKIDENEEEIDIIYSIVKNTLNKIINSKYKSYVFETEGKIFCIMSDFFEPDFHIKEFLKTNLEKTYNFLIKKFEIDTFFAVSKFYSNVEMLSLAYEDINTIFEYIEISENPSKIIFFEDINKEYTYSSNNEILIFLKKMLESITINNFKNILEYNDTLVKKIQKYSQTNPKIAKVYINTYKDLILNTLININSDFDKDEIINIMKNVQQTNDINILKDIFKKVVDLALYTNETNENKKPYWLNAIYEYIVNNYNQPELCVKTIANKFDISIEHLSRTFKRFIGVNLSDFIQMVRLEKVKKLLEESNLSIKEIAEKTGYLDSKALIRAFKNYIGTTPSKYREKNYKGR